jgi:hypothetical protein
LEDHNTGIMKIFKEQTDEWQNLIGESGWEDTDGSKWRYLFEDLKNAYTHLTKDLDNSQASDAEICEWSKKNQDLEDKLRDEREASDSKGQEQVQKSREEFFKLQTEQIALNIKKVDEYVVNSNQVHGEYETELANKKEELEMLEQEIILLAKETKSNEVK